MADLEADSRGMPGREHSSETFKSAGSKRGRDNSAGPGNGSKSGRSSSSSRTRNETLQRMLKYIVSQGFDLQLFLNFMNKQKIQPLQKARRLPILLDSVSVTGVFEDVKRFPSVLASLNILWKLYKCIMRKNSRKKLLLRDINLLIEDGESCLILGRRGSGAEHLVRLIGGSKHKIGEINGAFEYGRIDHKTFRKSYGNEAIYSSGADRHVSSLTVSQTIGYCLNFMAPKISPDASVSRQGYIEIMREFVLKSLGISRTKSINIGDEFHRGISGGERRRVSLAEILACDTTIIALNNAADGLDSSTAYTIISLLKNLVNLTGKISVVSLSVASDSLLYLFDKVVVLEQGHLIYAGPVGEVCNYMQSLGFIRHGFETDADYVTGIIDSGFTRQRRNGDSSDGTTSAAKLAKIYKESTFYKTMRERVINYYFTDETIRKRNLFTENVIASKSGWGFLRKSTSFKPAYWRQLLLLTQKAFIISVQDHMDVMLSLLVYIVLAFIIGISFAGMKISEDGIQDRKNFLFSCIIVNCLQGYSETVDNFRWREIVSKHGSYRMYRNSSQNLGAVISRIPLILFKVLVFTLIVYPLAFKGFGDADAVLDFYFTNSLVTMIATVMFRFVSTISATPSSAAKIASLFITFLITFSGFIVQGKDILPQFRILFSINPLNLALQNNLYTHFKDLVIYSCPEEDLIPHGPSYVGKTKGTFCKFSALESGGSFHGETYLEGTYDIRRGDYSLNLITMMVIMLIFIGLLLMGAELGKFSFDHSMDLRVKDRSSKIARCRRYVLNKIGSMLQRLRPRVFDAKEKPIKFHDGFADNEHTIRDSKMLLGSNYDEQKSLIWKNINYRVKVDGEVRQLLCDMNGYAKRGVMTALMGASGAGKTTLLDVIVGRRSSKHVTGDIYLDNAKFDKRNHRKYAYCEQMDILLETHTVREALKFSARLRQDRKISEKAKDEFVENMIRTLEIEQYADAIIGHPMLGYGIDRGLKKLVTIGIELCSRPSTILLLDEPTTGLDSKSALQVVKILRKLANSGLAIVCTVHQPTRAIFDQFDNLILVAPGGKLMYFGEIGRDGTGILKFLFDRGVRYDHSLSIPEFIIDVIRSGSTVVGSDKDWASEWIKSDENRALIDEIDRLLLSKESVQSTANPDAPETEVKDEPPLFLEKLRLVVSRDLKWIWRSPSYTLTRVLNHEMIGLFMLAIFLLMKNVSHTTENSHKPPKNESDLQMQVVASLLSAFQFLAIPALLIPSLIPKFVTLRQIHDREESSGTHSKGIFALSMFISELPLTIICPCMLITTYYFSGPPPIYFSNYLYVCFMASLLSIYALTLGLWIASILPSFYIGARFTPLIVMPFGFFSGILIPYQTLSELFKKTIYYINPFSWGLMAILYMSVPYEPIPCSEEIPGTYKFKTSPLGMDCLRYVSEYVKNSINPGQFGYVVRSAGGFNNRTCTYCPVSSSKEFLAHYGDLGHGSSFLKSSLVIIFMICLNLALFLIFSTRLKMSKA